MQANTTTNPSIPTRGTRRNFMKNAGLTAAGLGGTLSVAPLVGAQETVSPDLETLIAQYRSGLKRQKRLSRLIEELELRPDYPRVAVRFGDHVADAALYSPKVLETVIISRYHLWQIAKSVDAVDRSDHNYDEYFIRIADYEAVCRAVDAQTERLMAWKRQNSDKVSDAYGAALGRGDVLSKEIIAFQCRSQADAKAKIAWAAQCFCPEEEDFDIQQDLIRLIGNLAISAEATNENSQGIAELYQSWLLIRNMDYEHVTVAEADGWHEKYLELASRIVRATARNEREFAMQYLAATDEGDNYPAPEFEEKMLRLLAGATV